MKLNKLLLVSLSFSFSSCHLLDRIGCSLRACPLRLVILCVTTVPLSFSELCRPITRNPSHITKCPEMSSKEKIPYLVVVFVIL